jgi:predicted DsbA family dithiol-disulfide isomerase
MFSACIPQSKNEIMKEKSKFSCDIETGVCAQKNQNGIEEINMNEQNKVKLIYYTDPICSACWAIEPELRKFKLEYGDYVHIEYKMGGLLPGWDGFSDNSNGISKPSDVGGHWDEVGEHSEMSIDGDVWIEDPLSSSYPPSIAFKAMQKQGDDVALTFSRNIREMVFLEKKNITKEQYLLKAVEKSGGDPIQFLTDYHNEDVKQSFYSEIQKGRKMGVRGFPTFIFVSETGSGFKISGMSGYENYILSLEKAYGNKIKPKEIKHSELDILKKYKFLATKEISVVLSQDKSTTIINLEKLVEKGIIKREKQKFGFFWRLVE